MTKGVLRQGHKTFVKARAAASVSLMSYSLNSVKGITWGFKSGTVTGVINQRRYWEFVDYGFHKSPRSVSRNRTSAGV